MPLKITILSELAEDWRIANSTKPTAEVRIEDIDLVSDTEILFLNTLMSIQQDFTIKGGTIIFMFENFIEVLAVFAAISDPDVDEDIKTVNDKLDILPFTEEGIRFYLDSRIMLWREIRDDDSHKQQAMAEYYIDAFQSVRMSIIGAQLSPDFVYSEEG